MSWKRSEWCSLSESESKRRRRDGLKEGDKADLAMEAYE